jgi:hypothetical protein
LKTLAYLPNSQDECPGGRFIEPTQEEFIDYHEELIITPLEFGYRPIRGSSGTVPKEFRWAFT